MSSDVVSTKGALSTDPASVGGRLDAMPALMTVEQFVAQREELPDGGRWTELAAGRLQVLSPPTVEHGTAVLNLGKALSEYSKKEKAGYACFELGLIVERNPDTLRFPAVSFFSAGPMFAESDKVVTATPPALVVEVASTNDRRRGLDQRVAGWLEWGVKLVWVLDPQGKLVHALAQGHTAQRLAEHQSLIGGTVLSGFKVEVRDLFQEPAWAK